MSQERDIDQQGTAGPPPTDEEIRAALEEEMRRVHVGDVVLQSVVTLVQLAGRRLGTAPGTEMERDLDQARVAIDSVSALLPSVEAVAPDQAPAVRNALSQLQLEFVRAGGAPADETADGGDGGVADARGGGEGPEGPGGGSRLWVPPGVR